MGVKELVKRALTEKENRKYQKRLEQIRVTYPDWASKLESGWSEGSEQKELQAESDFVVICASQGIMSENAFYHIGCYFNEHPEVQVLYGDEDVIPGCGQRLQDETELGERMLPWFKPDWSPNLLDSCLYFGSLTALRRELFDRVSKYYNECLLGKGTGPAASLQFRQTDGDVFWVQHLPAYQQWLHVCVDLAGGYRKGSAAIGHIPMVLFHVNHEREQIKFLEFTPYLQERAEECAMDFRESWATRKAQERDAGFGEEQPVVSVVIPSKDHPEVLEKCLRGCRRDQDSGLPVEILLVDNGSSQENRRRVEQLVQDFNAPAFEIHYLYRPMEFNFSCMCNFGAEQARGRFLLFLNDDVELCTSGSIEKMAALADRPFAGAVGIKLRYPESTRIQHAGITNLPMGPVHKLQFLNDDMCYYYGANRGYRNVLAVTAACLMVARDRFLEAGGFAEELQVAFNDVDLCFRLHELGYRNVCINDMYAYHHESLSRGDDESPEKLSRLLAERGRLYARHPELEGEDPYYSVHLNREGLDTGIRPTWITAGNRAQRTDGILERFDPSRCRQDQCLTVRIEDCRRGEITGYGVVLGDNNACYDKTLLLQRQDGIGLEGNPPKQGKLDSHIYFIKLVGQYRPDLEQNMPDQANVALSGFWVRLGEGALPGGRYRLGLTARNRVTGLQLINWSNRYFEVGEFESD